MWCHQRPHVGLISTRYDKTTATIVCCGQLRSHRGYSQSTATIVCCGQLRSHLGYSPMATIVCCGQLRSHLGCNKYFWKHWVIGLVWLLC